MLEERSVFELIIRFLISLGIWLFTINMLWQISDDVRGIRTVLQQQKMVLMHNDKTIN